MINDHHISWQGTLKYASSDLALRAHRTNCEISMFLNVPKKNKYVITNRYGERHCVNIFRMVWKYVCKCICNKYAWHYVLDCCCKWVGGCLNHLPPPPPCRWVFNPRTGGGLSQPRTGGGVDFNTPSDLENYATHREAVNGVR